MRQVSSNVLHIKKVLSRLHFCLPTAHWMGFWIWFPDFIMLLRLTLARETQQSYQNLSYIYLLIYCVCGMFMCVLLHMHVCAHSWRGYRLTLHVISGSHSYFWNKVPHRNPWLMDYPRLDSQRVPRILLHPSSQYKPTPLCPVSKVGARDWKCLSSKHFISWAISLAPPFLSFHEILF